jgi:hypothetical protein
MKRFFAILFLLPTVCVACEIRSTGSQTSHNHTVFSPSLSAQPTTPAVSDQAPCSLVMNQAPVINGLKLGMTPDQVLALFPGSMEVADVRSALSKPPNQFGESGFTIRRAKDELRENFAGLKQIVVDLLDGHASRYYVGYDGPEYSHVDKFVAKFIEGTNLPAVDQWEAYLGMDTQLKSLKCRDFEIKVFAGGKGGNLNYVDMRDLEAYKKVEERRKKADEKSTP